jgi:ankyrin repeat protein
MKHKVHNMSSLVAGCRLDIGDSDNLTPLHLAAARDHYKVAKMLLDAGVHVNCKTSDKISALHIAASRGFIDTVKVLLGGGANVDSLDASDRTPLLLAVSRGHDDVVQLLIKHGAKVNIEEIHGMMSFSIKLPSELSKYCYLHQFSGFYHKV